jgi:hypothetical protein
MHPKSKKISDLFTYLNVVYNREWFAYTKTIDKGFNSAKYNISKMGDIGSVEYVEYLPPSCKLKDQHDKTLLFDSRFESGNLSMAAWKNHNEYNLLLNFDTNTNGKT